jgi:hypothetical protein
LSKGLAAVSVGSISLRPTEVSFSLQAWEHRQASMSKKNRKRAGKREGITFAMFGKIVRWNAVPNGLQYFAAKVFPYGYYSEV